MTDATEWMRQLIAWEKAHPVRYRLRRIWYRTTHPRKTYREWVYWPVRTFVARGRKGWSVSDTWGLDTYIAGVLAGSLTYLAENLHGYPPSNLHKAQTFVRAVDMEPSDGLEAWRATILEMADGFAAWADHYDVGVDEDEDEAYRKVRRSIRLMHRWFGHLWD